MSNGKKRLKFMIEKARPYQQLAILYDTVMEHVNYKQWARYVLALIDKYGAGKQTVCDLACGTGSLLPYLAGRKRRVVGCDLSLSMLRRAKEKFSGQNVPLICADFRAVPLAESVCDAAVILYDSINYLHSGEEILNLFGEAARILKPGGVLVFDAVLPYVCREVFDGYEDVRFLSSDLGYRRQSWFDRQEGVQYNRFQIYANGQVFEELHRQRIWTLSEWREIIEKNRSLNLQAIHGDFTFRNVRPKSERAHFVLRKPGNSA